MIDIQETLTVVILPNWLVILITVLITLHIVNDVLRLYLKYLEWKLQRLKRR